MEQEFINTIETNLSEAPIEISNGLKKIEWHALMSQIGKAHDLYEDQIEDLYRIVVDFTTGKLEVEDLPYEIADRLILEKKESAQIMQDLDRVLFVPLARLLQAGDTTIGGAQNKVNPMLISAPTSQRDLIERIRAASRNQQQAAAPQMRSVPIIKNEVRAIPPIPASPSISAPLPQRLGNPIIINRPKPVISTAPIINTKPIPTAAPMPAPKAPMNPVAQQAFPTASAAPMPAPKPPTAQ